MKDFQIGRVEGIVSDAIKSDEGPKDVFSKIAQAIGRKASSTKGKKDWNAMVRKSTHIRDPIGSTADRQSRQSLRRHILDNPNSMDPERLVEYNPMLSSVTPATRVAYAKFKTRKIKEEFDKRENSGLSENSSQKGDDEVFQPATSVKEVSETKGEPSIARPRPRAALASVASTTSGGKAASTPASAPAAAKETPTPSPAPPTRSQSTSSTNSIAPPPEAPARREFRPKTPIPEDPREGMTTPEPDDRPKSSASVQGSRSATPASRPQSSASTASKKDDNKDDKKEESKTAKASLKPSTAEPPKRSPGPPKLGGKSTVSGETLQGWL